MRFHIAKIHDKNHIDGGIFLSFMGRIPKNA